MNISPLRADSKSDNTTNKSKFSLETPLSHVNGIGTKGSSTLAGFGMILIRDLLLHFPRDYIDYSSLKRINSLVVGEHATIVVQVRRVNFFTSPRNKNLSILDLQVQDVTGRIKVTRFFAGSRLSKSSYLYKQAKLFPVGSTLAVSGLVKDGKYGKCFVDPILELLERSNSIVKSNVIGRLLPVYSLCEGLTADKFRRYINSVLSLTSSWPEPLSLEQQKKLSLMSIQEAMYEIHLPTNNESLKQARRRIVFDEFYFLQLGLLRKKYQVSTSIAPSLEITHSPETLSNRFLKLLPFHLTSAQQRVLDEIKSDLSLTEPMARLIQGDVGSGKTVVAISALLHAVEAGWQGAFMAPTEVLANQHYRNLCKWLPQLHVTVELLTGSTTIARRRNILNDLSSGSLKIIVGTHALIEDNVSFARLGLVVVDEQHRFGVNQRNMLLNKGLQPHLLTMTATPIPRTLALSIHGDLDVSQIDELPPGRTQIKTTLFFNSQRKRIYSLIRDHVSSGQQVYFVLPLVEESEKVDLRSAVNVFHDLNEKIFPEFSVGLLHGRMKSHEKDSAIRNFLSGELNILVSTTVIEVGVDVSNATLMIIDNADRFGLSQLHQLRGRVGRGAKSSECALVDSGKNPMSIKKLEHLVATNDGFQISEIDLSLRGPGQFLGTKQSGLPDFALANLINDSAVLELARKEALSVLEDDPNLSRNKFLSMMLDAHLQRFVGQMKLN
ncbi:ATP-dependent DNA helicase RecG [Prochlorococcus sp. MIT 0601]|nr:ATP-dependent DNA helicase RecG [Prochlorococcus sp. MIT 0601]